ncbi:MAG: hypothetical protein ACLT5P_02810 [Flavonifractor plautii]
MAAGASIRSCLRPLLRRGRRRQRGFLHPSLHPSPQPREQPDGSVRWALRRPALPPLLSTAVAHRGRRAARTPGRSCRGAFAYDDTPRKARVYFRVGGPTPARSRSAPTPTGREVVCREPAYGVLGHL